MSFDTRISIIASSLLLLTISPALAGAQENYPADDLASSPAYQQMLDLSDEATEAVLNGDFEIGAVKFRIAYRTFPDPILLKNEMIAWFRAEDCLSALPPAADFLESDDVQPKDREDVQTVQTQCHLQLAEDAIAELNPLLATHHLEAIAELPRDKEAERRYRKARHELDGLPIRLAPPDAHSSSSAASSRTQTLGWAQIATGLAMGGAGLAVHSVYLDRKGQLAQFERSERPEAQLLYITREKEWQSFLATGRWAIPTLYTLSALTIGSGIFFLTRQHTDAASFTPSAGPREVGLIITKRF